jgi:NADH-quinone oxidoreductase subunit L
VSQLGYMMAALGAGALAAGVLHLLLHGFFKALLFLAAGAVIHAVHTNDMWAMGRLARAMPKTALVFVVGTLALAGIPPFSGFVSKEAILAGVWSAGLPGPFVLLAVTVFLTAFYMFRAVFVTFLGPRAAAAHPHDPPAVMMSPLWLLAVLSVAGVMLGGAGLGQTFPEFLGRMRGSALPHGPEWLTPVSVGLALGGLLLAWLVYQRGAISAAALARLLGPLPGWAAQGYGLDAVYAAVYRGAVLALGRLVGWVDRYLVDGVVNVASAATLRAGAELRRLQTGRAQDYLYGVTAGLLLVLVFWRLWA